MCKRGLKVMWKVGKKGFFLGCFSIVFLFMSVHLSIAQTGAFHQPPAKLRLLYVVNQGSNTITAIDLLNLKTVREADVKGLQPADLAVTPDGQTLFVANRVTGNVSVIDATSFEVVARIQACKQCSALALAPGGKELWVVDSEGSKVAIVDLASKERGAPLPVVGTIATGETPGHVWFSPDGKRAYVSIQKAGTVEVYDTASRGRVATIPVGKNPNFLLTSPDGKQLWGVNAGGDDLFVIDAGTNHRIATIQVGARPQRLSFVDRRPKGLFVYVTVGGKDEVVTVDAKTLKLVERIPVGEAPRGIWTSQDQRFVYVSHEASNEVYLIETGTGLITSRIRVGKRPVAVLASIREPLECKGAAVCEAVPEEQVLEPTAAKLIYTANEESNTVTVIDGPNLRVITEIDVQGRSPRDLAAMGNGQVIFVANLLSGDVSIIDTTNFQVVARLPVCKRCQALHVAPDGRELWVADSESNKISIIDLVSLDPDVPFPVIDTISTGKAPGYIWFNKEGTRAYVTAQKDGTFEVYDRWTRKKLAAIPVGKNPTIMVTRPGGKEIWGVNAEGNDLFVIDVEANRLKTTVPVGGKPRSLHFVDKGPRGAFVYVTLGEKDEVAVVEAETRKVVGRIPVGRGPRGIWTSEDQKIAYIGHETSNDLYVIETGTDTVLATIPVGRKPVAVLAWTRETYGEMGCTFGEVCPLDFMQTRLRPEDVWIMVARVSSSWQNAGMRPLPTID